MNHIVIIGFMGSGKTRVGKRLAKDFNLPFVDVDRVVSKKMNLTMKEIFDRFGEPFYRALETTVIKALIDDPEQKIISLGSGLPMQEQNAKYIKKLGTVVYLKGSYATLKKRLENSSSNPLIEGSESIRNPPSAGRWSGAGRMKIFNLYILEILILFTILKKFPLII